jgi:hypothetical protein
MRRLAKFVGNAQVEPQLESITNTVDNVVSKSRNKQCHILAFKLMWHDSNNTKDDEISLFILLYGNNSII